MAAELWVSGPILDLTLHGVGESVSTESLQGLVDTGASVVCMDKRVAKRLGLKAINQKPMQVADGTLVEATVYMAEMAVPELNFKDWVEIYALPMSNPSQRVLLGRSFLKNYLVTYNGPEDLFHWSRPSAALHEDLDG